MEKPNECRGCPLYEISHGFSHPEGEGTLGVTLVGEALGREERIDGLPFRPHAQSGSKLTEVLSSLGLRREQFILTNVIQCQPPGNELEGKSYEAPAINHCQRHRRDYHYRGYLPQVSEALPDARVYVALGNVALKALTSYSGAGDAAQSISYMRGFVLPHKDGKGLVVPSYHPAYLRRGQPKLTPVLEADIRRAVATARGEFTQFPGHPAYKAPSYNTEPSLEDAYSYLAMVRDNPQLVLAFDIETPTLAKIDEAEREVEEQGIEIKQIQFSVRRGQAIAMPWAEPYIDVILALLQTPNLKANHNIWNFDLRVLRAKGVQVVGPSHDTMWMFKHYQPGLERNLQKAVSLFGFPFPWKHLFGDQLAYYGCADVDAVHWLLSALPPLMKQMDVWKGYHRHVYQLEPILLRASQRGLPINLEAHQELEARLSKQAAEMHQDIQKLVPLELRNFKPTKKDKETGEKTYGYIREPKPVNAARALYQRISSQPMDTLQRLRLCSEGVFIQRKTGLVEWTFSGSQGPYTRWAKAEDFSIGSPKQMIAYLKWQAAQQPTKAKASLYRVPLTLKSRKETTAKDELQDILDRTGDPVIAAAIELRSIRKMLTNDLPNWMPGADGRVHTTFHFVPPSGQLGARNPNILNASKHTDLGQEFRRIIEAPKGYTFLEFDYKAFHVAMLGFLAEDASYLRFARLDPHGLYTCVLLGAPIDILQQGSEGELRELLREYKAAHQGEGFHESFSHIRSKLAKPTVLGNQLGLGARKLWHQNRKYIRDESHASSLQMELARVYPKVEATKDSIREEAYQRHYLRNWFGRIQWFYEVFTWRKNRATNQWERVNGYESEKALAFPVQSNAFGHITEVMLEAERLGWNERFNFVNSIHDSLIYMPRLEEVEECKELVYKLMVAPSKILRNSICPEGLQVNVEVSQGRNWQKYDKVSNPDGMREVM